MGPAAAPLQHCSLAALACEAMKSEVFLTPKPGLVDSLDRGAHKDMSVPLFLRSADAIAPFLEAMVGAAPVDGPSSGVLPLIRPIGVEAERAMFQATGGINTHKGQIFTLGVCSTAAKRVLASGDNESSPLLQVLDEAARLCAGLTDELASSVSDCRGPTRTNGQSVYQKYGCSGIRGEAEQGFPSVRTGSLPAFKRARQKDFSEEEAALEALVYLMAVVEDSNILHRSGLTGLSRMRMEAEGFLYAGGMEQLGAVEKLEEMNQLFISENLSPGGCADLLALTLFLIKLEDLWYEQTDLFI